MNTLYLKLKSYM